jgi:hypothetical protein
MTEEQRKQIHREEEELILMELKVRIGIIRTRDGNHLLRTEGMMV